MERTPLVSLKAALQSDCLCLNALVAGAATEAVVVGRFGFIGRWNRAQHRGSLQGFLLCFLGGRHADDVVVGACLEASGETLEQAGRRCSGVCSEVPLEV